MYKRIQNCMDPIGVSPLQDDKVYMVIPAQGRDDM